jgi:hypothetical protein
MICYANEGRRFGQALHEGDPVQCVPAVRCGAGYESSSGPFARVWRLRRVSFYISASELRYEDSIRPVLGGSHSFSCPSKNIQKFELIDNSKGTALPGTNPGYWLNLTCPPLNPISLAFSGSPADAKQDSLRAQQARAGRPVAPEPARPNISAQAEADLARGKYINNLFEVVRDSRFPGVEKYKLVLVTTSSFKNGLVTRQLVDNVNKLYGWNLAEDGNWTVQQTNDVMFDIVAKPGFDVQKALAAIAANRKP